MFTRDYFRNRGFVILLMLLFLTVFSMIFLNIFEKSLWDHRMERLYEDKIKSFYLAEECLLQKERSLLHGDISMQSSCAQVELLAEKDECNVDLYAVTARGKQGDSVTMLRSVVAKYDDQNSCALGKKIPRGRVSFLWHGGPKF